MAGNSELEEPGAADRRAHPRLAVELRARVELARDARPARILDFCAGGLFIEVQGQEDDYLVMAARQVGRGEELTVTFQATGDSGAPETFAVPVTVARLFAGGMGVAFSPPEPAAVRALERVARRSRSRTGATSGGDVAGGGLPAEEARSIAAALRSRLDRWLRVGLEDLFKQACEALFVEARDATSNEVQSECMDALKDVERVKDTVGESAAGAVVRSFDRFALGPGERVEDGGLESSGSESLALVDTGSFDDWVTTKNIISRYEPRLRDDAYALARRLSVVFGREVDELSNPAGLQQIGTAFNEAMQNLGLMRRARAAIYHALETVLIVRMPAFYEELNNLLVERGVLPTVTRPSPTKPKRAPSGEPARPPEAPAEEPSPEEVHGESGRWVAQPPGAAPGPGDSGRWRAPGAAPGPGAVAPPPGTAAAPGQAPWTGPAAEASPGAGVPAVEGGQAPAASPGAPAWYTPTYQSPIAPAVPQVPMERAYQAARSLMGLRRAVSAGDAIAAQPQPVATPAVSGASQALMGALDHLQRAPEFAQAPPRQALRLRERLRESLAREGVTLNAEESEAVDVLTGLIEAVLGDPLIAANVKPRIHRLSVPLLKVALRDQGFFMEDAHPARQVVDRLGMLGLPESLASGEEGDSLSEAVDPLLQRIVDDGDADPRVFESVLPELDAIIARQGERFESNVSSLVEARERQQQMLAERRGGEPPPARQVPPELAPWFQRTGRLGVGDMVTFKAGTDAPEPRALAWVSDDKETFVFADRNGHQSGSLTQQELALEMMRGTARVSDSPDVPAMDRGVYEMLHQIHQALVDEGQRDKLTGLMSPGAFEARLEEAAARAQREGARHALMALDLDNFSSINEACGRKAGDSLLRKLSRLLQRQIGEQGCLTRVAGDQFLLLLENHGFQDARRFAERQCRAIDNSRVQFEGEQYPITASIGLAPVTRAGGSAADLIGKARAALAVAKRRGGNQLRVYDPDEDAEEAPLDLPTEGAERAGADDAPEGEAVAPSEEGLGALLDAGRLVLRRHPVHILDPEATDKPMYEVLIGIRAGDDSVADASREMLQAAEAEGRMVDVDQWLLATSLGWMAANRRELIKSGGFTINLSGATLAREDLLEFVMELLTDSAVPPAKVIFEITESLAIDRLSSAVDFIRTLREFGCRFSVDDFGAGHTTFAYLKTLPVDFVKIDGVFVRDIAENEADFAMVKSIYEIAHLLGKQTVAESVDSDAVLVKLRELGVTYGQGAAVAEPLVLD